MSKPLIYSVRGDKKHHQHRVEGYGQKCYGTLAPGAADGTINIKIGDTIYHTVQ